jgi:hypothetical protein
MNPFRNILDMWRVRDRILTNGSLVVCRLVVCTLTKPKLGWQPKPLGEA